MRLKLPILAALLLVVGFVSMLGLYYFFSPQNEEAHDSAFDLPADRDTSGWTQTSGPLGGTVVRMVPREETVWASLYSGGIYELQKEGMWKQVAIGFGIPENRSFDIVEDPSNADIVYVPETVACMAKTTTGGSRWIGLCDSILKDISAHNFTSHTLALDPADPNTLYVPGYIHDHTSMLLVSTDGGATWEKRFVFPQQVDFNHLFFFDSRMYLATLENGVLVSSDKGKSWAPLNTGLKKLTTARFVNFNDSLYLLGARFQHNTREGGDVYRLSGGGSSWEKVRGVEDATGIATGGETLFVGTLEPALLTSKDGVGFTREESIGLPADWIGEIVRVDGSIYVGAGGNGVYVSSDGGKHFEEANAGMSAIATRDVHVNPHDENEIYVGTWDRPGFYWSKNGGRSYKRLLEDRYVFVLAPDPQDFSRMYAGGNQFLVGNVSKENSTFTEKTKPGSNTSFIKSIAVDPSDSNHVLVGIATNVAETPPGEGLWESRDGGESWRRATGIEDFAVYSILFHPTDPNLVYASALGSGVFKSTDGGSHFVHIGGDALTYTYRLAMSKGDASVLVASSNLFFAQLSDEDQYSGKYGGIFQSRDGGATWKELTAGIRNYEGGSTPADFLGWLYNFGHMPNYEMVLIDPNDPSHLIVGHHGENVVVTRDGGATWEKQGAEQMVPGNIHNYAYCLGSSPDLNKIYACTCGRGLFRGVMNKSGEIAWSLVEHAYADELELDAQPRNAEEARRLILSGEYNHEH